MHSYTVSLSISLSLCIFSILPTGTNTVHFFPFEREKEPKAGQLLNSERKKVRRQKQGNCSSPSEFPRLPLLGLGLKLGETLLNPEQSPLDSYFHM